MSKELAEKFNSIGSPKIWTTGDGMVDLDVYGLFGKRSQENPDLNVFLEERKEHRGGGAHAAAIMACNLGADNSIYWYSAGISSKKTRYFVGDKMVFRHDLDPVYDEDYDYASIERGIPFLVSQAEMVLVSDYGKGFLTERILRIIIDQCEERKIPCLVDPALGRDWALYRGCSLIKCNGPEFDKRSCSWSVVTEAIVITEGKNGILFDSINQGSGRIKGIPIEMVDVTGCGDMVFACLGVCLAGGMTLRESCKIANVAASLKCQRHGAIPVPKEEIIQALLDSVE